MSVVTEKFRPGARDRESLARRPRNPVTRPLEASVAPRQVNNPQLAGKAPARPDHLHKLAARDLLTSPLDRTAVDSLYITADAPRRTQDRRKVVQEHTSRIAALVRRQARGRDQAEALQEGLLALLEALELFDPERGVPFWAFAYAHVHGAIANWVAKERTRGFGSRTRRRSDDPRTVRAMARVPKTFDELLDSESEDNPESLAIEQDDRLREMVVVSGLSGSDKRTLGIHKGRVKADATSRHISLRERARAFLGGER